MRGVIPAELRLLALALTAAVLGCGDLLRPDRGQVKFVLSPAGASVTAPPADPSGPAPTVAAPEEGVALSHRDKDDDDEPTYPGVRAVTVTFLTVAAHDENDELVEVEMALPASVTLAPIEEGEQLGLPGGFLPDASYDGLTLVLSGAEVVTDSGDRFEVDDAWSAMVPSCRFRVGEGKTTTVALAVGLEQSLERRGNAYEFAPRFACVFVG